jgi:hypothetical protein
MIMKKNPLPDFREQLESYTVIKRQIKTKGTTFSFYIYDSNGSLGLDFVETLRDNKQLLGLAGSRWSLPKLIRVIVEDLGESEDLGGKIMEESDIFYVRVELEGLHDLKLLCKDRKDFRIKMLWLFLRKLAHLKNVNEEDDLMVAKLLNAAMKKLK